MGPCAKIPKGDPTPFSTHGVRSGLHSDGPACSARFAHPSCLFRATDSVEAARPASLRDLRAPSSRRDLYKVSAAFSVR